MSNFLTYVFLILARRNTVEAQLNDDHKFLCEELTAIQDEISEQEIAKKNAEKKFFLYILRDSTDAEEIKAAYDAYQVTLKNLARARRKEEAVTKQWRDKQTEVNDYMKDSRYIRDGIKQIVEGEEGNEADWLRTEYYEGTLQA